MFPPAHQNCQNNFSSPLDLKSVHDALPKNKVCSLTPKKFFFLSCLLFFFSGCLAISDQEISFRFSPREKDSHSSQTPLVTATKDSSDPVEEENKPIRPPHFKITSALEQQLSEDRWRKQTIWPDPIAGIDAINSLRLKPIFRWQHQGLLQHQTENQEKFPLKDSQQSKDHAASDHQSTATTVQTTSKNDQATSIDLAPKAQEKFSQFVPELKTIASRDDFIGHNATILLAQSSPRLLIPEQLLQLQKVAIEGMKYDTKSGERIADGKTKASSRSNSSNSASVTLNSNSNADEKTISTSNAMQAAAAEAWCYAIAVRSHHPEEDFAAAGHALKDQKLSQAVRIELLRGIARKIKPRRIPTLENQFSDFELQQRQLSPLSVAAIDACLLYAINHPQLVKSNQATQQQSVIAFDAESLDPLKIWSPNIWNLRWHQDLQAINRFGMWLALTKPPIAQNYLFAQLNHIEPSVQYHAIRNIGILGSEPSMQKLEEIIESRPGNFRAVGLLAIGSRNEKLIYSYQNDSSPTVRTAVAHYAAQHSSGNSALVLQELTQDADLKIQQAAVVAVAAWSNKKAFPVLSAAFSSGGIPTRNLARKKLEQRFGIVITALEDDTDQRKQILNTISHKFHVDAHVSRTLIESSSSKTTAETFDQENLNREKIEKQLQELLTEITQKEISSFHRQRLSRELNRLIEQSPQSLDETLNLFDLKKLEQTLEQINSLEISSKQYSIQDFVFLNDKQLKRRRDAAKSLAQQAKKQTLADWKLRLIGKHLKQEQDLHICRNLMLTITDDTTPQAREVAQIALLHTWPDVRVLGCQYVQKHRLPQLAPFLLPLLQSRNQSIQQAAILACGYCQNPVVIDGFGETSGSGQRSGLRVLLGTLSRENELLVIAGLARLGDEQGRSELLKLSYSSDAQTRQQVVRIMGELQDQKMIGHLIRIGWTESTPHVRIAILEALKNIVPKSKRPKLIAIQTPEKKMELWSQWFEKQKRTL